MKPIFTLLFIGFCMPFFASAQSNYKPGYVVTLKGDTLHGFIDYREWNTNPVAINFKDKSADKAIRKFTPDDIGYFTIENVDSYIRYSGPVSIDIIDPDHIGSARDTGVKTVTAFFRILQKGPNIALYSYADNIKARYFIGYAPGYPPEELGYKVYYRSDMTEQQGRTITENAYMKQLYNAAQKYDALNSSLQWDIEHADYHGDDLLKIVSRINRISKNERQLSRNKLPLFNLFVSGGINIDHTTTPPGVAYSTAGGKDYTSYLPAASFGINFFANPVTRQLQLRLEFIVSGSKYISTYDSKVIPYVPTRATFDELQFTLAPQVIYNFYNTENFKVFGGIGFVVTYTNYSNVFYGPITPNSDVPDLAEYNQLELDNIGDTFMLKAGVQFSKRLAIFANYQLSTIIARGSYFQLSSNSIQAGLNYFFK